MNMLVANNIAINIRSIEIVAPDPTDGGVIALGFNHGIVNMRVAETERDNMIREIIKGMVEDKSIEINADAEFEQVTKAREQDGYIERLLYDSDDQEE